MLLKLLSVVALLQVCYAPPVSKNKQEEENKGDMLEDVIEYHRYIKEVVNVLENDPQFRDKLEKAKEEDIRSGKIATELEYVSHQVRTQLDEIKRRELNRLRELTAKRKELMQTDHVDDPMHHVDTHNPHTFEIEDLKRLIVKTTQDLAEADKKRRDEFKEYELQKEYEKWDKLNHSAPEERVKIEKEFKEAEEKHKKHEKLHQPGHKQQLEEVWEEQDHMQQDFDPKTFFMLHDLDSNGMWDQEEVKALFIKELDKMYSAGAPEDDMRERVEEMERMRESVFKEMDTNGDGFIDYNEFLAQTKRNDFEKDNGWQGLDEQHPYTDEELEQYIRQHQMQMQYQQGYHPNDINSQMYPPNAYHHPQAYPPPGNHPGQGLPHQMPPPHPGQAYPQQQMQGGHAPPQGYHPQGGQMPPQGYHPQGGQMPQQGYHPQGNQMPHQGYHPQMPVQGQAPPRQEHAPSQSQGQLPPQTQGQIPPQGGQPAAQFHPGKIPQTQVHPQKIENQDNMALNTNEIYPGNPQGQHLQQPNAVPPAQQNQQQPQYQQQQQPPQQQQQQNQPPPQQQQQNQQPPQQQNQLPNVQQL